MDRNSISRRQFLARSAVLAGTLMAGPKSHAKYIPYATSEDLPSGKIVIAYSSTATLDRSLGTVNESKVQTMVDRAVTALTGRSDVIAAFEALFPGLDVSKKIAIKPNTTNIYVPTRKEIAKALINRFTQMLGGTFPSNNIYIYEIEPLESRGYTNAYLGAGVHFVQQPRDGFPDLGHYIFCDGHDRPYSETLHECDYLVNVPVLKDHGMSLNFTLSMKNHLATVAPQGPLGIHGNKTAMLDVNASNVVRTKTRLILLDALFGVYDGGPNGLRMEWETFADSTPNRILGSIDPVTIDYYGRLYINTERLSRGMSAKAGTYIEEAAAAPYDLGIADPSLMDVIEINVDTSAVEDFMYY